MVQKKLIKIDKKNIVFDLTGVLFNPCKKKIVGQVGVMRLLWYMVRHLEKPTKVFDRAFDFMDLISPVPQDSNYNFRYKDRLMSQLAYDLMIGKITSKELLELLYKRLIRSEYKKFFRSFLEQSMLKKITETFFSSELIVKKILRPINGGIQVVKDFYKKVNGDGQRAHKLYLLSNFDSETFELLAEKYADLFKRFDGIMISADVGCLKPENKIYEKFFNKFQLDPKECFFIDDQSENIVAAKKFGMDGITFNQ